LIKISLIRSSSGTLQEKERAAREFPGGPKAQEIPGGPKESQKVPGKCSRF
jgi:hypothetical protein